LLSIPAVLAVTLAASVALAPAPAFAQAAKPWAVPRTPDGQPDLHGMWVNFDSTPFETAGTAPNAPVAVPQGTGINPPSHWADHDSPMRAARPAMVVDPPDGKVPVMKWAEDKRAYDLEHVADNWVHQTPWERCITRGIPAGMFPAGYNNGYQFIQTPGYVVIVYEMIHATRVILRRPAARGANIRTWAGDPRGHWDGNTLRGHDELQQRARSPRAPRRTNPRHPAERSAASSSASRRWRRTRSNIATVDDKNVYQTVDRGDAADATRLPAAHTRRGASHAEHPRRRPGGGEEIGLGPWSFVHTPILKAA
jgi:hypothetical protein